MITLCYSLGVVKITPAHDPNDYEMGKRHDLPFINIFDDDGNVIGDYGKFTVLYMYFFKCITKRFFMLLS